MKHVLLTATVFFICLSYSAHAQPVLPKEIPLRRDAPGRAGKSGIEKVRITEGGDHVISNIHRPSITPFIPAGNKAAGAAVIIAPGGGHRELWIDHEGYNPAQWLRQRGIAAFVLKYRLAREDSSTYAVEKEALADIQRAIRLVRSRAKEWNVDTAKIGVMGFSAGGELAGLAAMRFDKGDPAATDAVDRLSSYPAFQALIYPGNSGKLEPAKASPPLFLVGGYKDRPDISEGIARLYLQYKQAGISTELHIYASAGHGFGMRPTNRAASATWSERFIDWLSDLGFLNHQ